MGSPVTQIPKERLSASPVALLSSPERRTCKSLASELLTSLDAPTIDCGRIVLLEKLDDGVDSGTKARQFRSRSSSWGRKRKGNNSRKPEVRRVSESCIRLPEVKSVIGGTGVTSSSSESHSLATLSLNFHKPHVRSREPDRERCEPDFRFGAAPCRLCVPCRLLGDAVCGLDLDMLLLLSLAVMVVESLPAGVPLPLLLLLLMMLLTALVMAALDDDDDEEAAAVELLAVVVVAAAEAVLMLVASLPSVRTMTGWFVSDDDDDDERGPLEETAGGAMEDDVTPTLPEPALLDTAEGTIVDDGAECGTDDDDDDAGADNDDADCVAEGSDEDDGADAVFAAAAAASD
ncbi:hypothetical protein EGW08_004322 [Elysia chlorotica]|uniref:Uncharacterized protein n=1 Tax=Elysia chlorotica TaxID=188477 RepID=A0A3S0ZWQ7_ELYCH|nr:hypothetical protein EGW08_004322 [Elysia chlorotica]